MAQRPLVAVLDANVLFPFTLRDTLLRGAAADFYQARWSPEILDEMTRNLVSSDTTTAAKAQRLRRVMERAFPDAEVTGYQRRLDGLKNHPKDQHVVAAALKAGAGVIVTANLKDFVPLPAGVEAVSPDTFLSRLFESNPQGFVSLLLEQASDLSRPPTSFDQLLEHLEGIAPKCIEAVRAAASRTKKSKKKR